MQRMIIVDIKTGRIIAEASHSTEGILSGGRWHWIAETVADHYACWPRDVAPLDTDDLLDGITVGRCLVARTLQGQAASDYSVRRLAEACVVSTYDALRNSSNSTRHTRG